MGLASKLNSVVVVVFVGGGGGGVQSHCQTRLWVDLIWGCDNIKEGRCKLSSLYVLQEGNILCFFRSSSKESWTAFMVSKERLGYFVHQE